MELSIDEVKLLAQRSRLALSEKELKKYARDLGALEELSAALLPFFGPANDTEEPFGLSDMREDRVEAGICREEILKLSELRREEFFSVPCTLGEV